MNKNTKIIFLFATIMLILLAIGSATAADVDNTTITSKASTSPITQEKTLDTPAKEVNKVVNKETVKKETNIEYYVSNSGDDTNDGTQENPYKTIQTAINKTTEGNQYTIHILEGTYKGEGNTNLTVPGTNNIKFIGSGVNKTIFDGEANFTLPKTGNDAWGGSAFWNSWSNVSGNWVMNITPGNGIISIENFTIQNAWSNSGSSIAACPTSTVDNRATLYATNVYFDSNHAGNGAGIRNHDGATLYVDNCTFFNNTKAQSTGNFGAAIYNNGTALVINSNIINNYARWGSVTNDKNITMINCTFKDNCAYDGGSGYKNGPSFTADTGITNFYQMYGVFNLTSTIINCTFDNNQQCDISNGRGDLIVDNCVFNHSTGIYLFPNNNRLNTYNPTQNITNNQFTDMQPSTVFATTISSTTPSVAVRSLSNYNVTIENNNIDVPDTVSGYGLYLTGNATVKNNTLNNYIYIAGQNATIINNTIDTTRDCTIELTSAARDATIINNTLLGGFTNGDLSVKNVQATTILENNQPVSNQYTINDENYTTFFDENGVLRNNMVVGGSNITIVNNLTNKDLIFDNIKVNVDVQTTLINTTITVRNNARVYFNNLTIENTKNEKGYVILLDSKNNYLKNANIHVITDKPLQAIKIEQDENTLNTVTLNMTAPAADVEYNDDYSIGTAPTIGVLIRSSYNLINSSRIYVYSDSKIQSTALYPSPTVEGMDIQSKTVEETVSVNEIRSTRINVTGTDYVYGLNLARTTDTQTTLSYFDVTSDNYAVAIQQGSSRYNNIAGYIYANADNIAYGFYSTAMGSTVSKDTNISKLYIQNIQSQQAVGVRMEGTTNTIIGDATYTINGDNVKAIEIEPDYLENQPENVTINKLTLNLNGQTENSAVMTFLNTTNVHVNGSNIKSTNGTGITLTNSANAVVENNYINIANLIGGNAAVKSDMESVIRNNTPTIVMLTDDTYSNFFDENATLTVDCDIITIAGDLHNKDIKLNLPTKLYNITNLEDFTIYNGTIIIFGDSSVYNDPTKVLRVTGINFDNTNKPVFKDELEGTIQNNIYFSKCDIKVTGDDITAFEAFNNNSAIYLDIADSNITMKGKNAIVATYSGYTSRTALYFNDNIINVEAEETSMVINAQRVALQFNNNNVTQTGKTVLTANLTKGYISYYNFDENNINASGDNVQVLNYRKESTGTSYISDNNITLSSPNPITAINITVERYNTVDGNNITLDSNNGQTPIVYSNVATTVRDNYLRANDLGGNLAVESEGTVSGNTPEQGVITVHNTTWYAHEESTLSFIITDSTGRPINGTVTVTINDEEIPVTDNTITYTPAAEPVPVTITYVDPEGEILSSTVTVTVPVIPTPFVNITTDSPTIGDTTNITADFYTPEGVAIDGERAVFRVNGKTLRNNDGSIIYVDIENGKAVLNDVEITSEWMKQGTTIQAVCLGSDNVEPMFTPETTINVTKREATVNITSDLTGTAGQSVTLTAKVTDNKGDVTTGRVVFKLNGKTLKDENGKAISVNVVDGVATTTYTIPAKTKANTYKLTAVFTENLYERAEAEADYVISRE